LVRNVVLLRGINLGSANRIAMPALRAALTAAGFESVRTYVQSGNIVLDSDQTSDELTAAIARLLGDEFRLQVPVVVRTGDELGEVVAHNPFPEEATINPKALQVTFRAAAVETDEMAALRARAVATEKVAAVGRELYSWHPDGIARSKLALAITPRGAAATTRNWTTVTTLLEMATDADRA
jgi:uncharacterized protein (DUF1697 family)